MKKTSAFIWWAVVVISFLLSLSVILNTAMPQSYDFHDGDISQTDIYAPFDVLDKVQTERRRENAAAQIKDQYTIDYSVNERITENLKNFLSLCSAASELEGMSVSEKAGYIVMDAGVDVDISVAEKILSMPKNRYADFSKTLVEQFMTVTEQGIVEKNEGLTQLYLNLTENGLSSDDCALGKDIADKFLEVNKTYDKEATEKERQRAKDQIEPTVYKKNQVIIRRGEAVTKDHIELLTSIGLMSATKTINVKYAVGIFLFLCIAYLSAGLYMRHKKITLTKDIGKISFTLFVWVVLLFVIMLMSDIQGKYTFLIPIPIAAILLSVFVDTGVSVLTAGFLSFAGTIMISQNEGFLMGMILFCALCAISYRRATNITGFAVISLIVSSVGALVFSAFALIDSKSVSDILRCALFGFVNAVASSTVAIGTITFWEMAFRITTPFKLSELASPEKKLMRRLLFEAPGTYHHSLMVGNLAEAACDRIGANALLARVGSYYHDIGKLKHPEYFKENQIGANPHDSMLPIDSAKTIISHVSDGLMIAHKYRLPKEICDIIAQHHATTTAGVFYQRALMQNEGSGEEVNRLDFTYPGPKPRTKEAAIVMLADSCEAAVRSLDDKSPENVSAMVDKIIKSRMTDGHLCECALTFSDLETISTTFVTMFDGYFHKRIKYDEQDKRERKNAGDNTD